MKNGKFNGSGWFSYSAYKKDMLDLFAEANKDIRKEIKKALTNHLTDDHRKIENTLKQNTKKLDQNTRNMESLKAGQTKLKTGQAELKSEIKIIKDAITKQ